MGKKKVVGKKPHKGTTLRQLQTAGFVGHEIRDVEKPLSIRTNMKDAGNREAKNPFNCTTAQCIKRAADTERVAVFRSTAYVEWEGENVIWRFMVPHDLLINVIDRQDNGLEPIPGTYTLLAPVGTQRLGEAVRRRITLAERRARGDAPPPEHKKVKHRHTIRDRWHFGSALEKL